MNLALISARLAELTVALAMLASAPAAAPAAQAAIVSDEYRLLIPQIQVDARLLPMGLTADRKMAVPDNYVDAGWFTLAARPGALGSVVVGAHVDNGGAIPGLFKNLKTLQIGDEVVVRDSAGGELTYRVTEIGLYDRDERNTDYVYWRADKPRLNLITCHGAWLPAENTYSHRLVVFTELVS